MSNKIAIAAISALVVCIVLAAAYFVLADNKETGGGDTGDGDTGDTDAGDGDTGDGEFEFTEEYLAEFGITLYEEEMRIVLHDVTTLEGLPFGNSDIPEKYVLLTFWACWCPDCNMENPSLQRLYDEYEGETFTVLTISIDTHQDMLEAYLEEYGYDFPVLINIENNLWKEYFPVIPTSFLLAPDGHVIAKIVDDTKNYTDWDDEEVRQILDYLMSMS